MHRKIIITALGVIAASAVYAEGRFERADSNADGQISLAEFKAAHEARAVKHFARMDSNGDGLLSADEMERSHRGQHRFGKHRGKMKAKKLVRRLDSDGSGSLSFDELQGRRMSPDLAGFTAADTNGNGELDATELRAMMKARWAARRGAEPGNDQ